MSSISFSRFKIDDSFCLLGYVSSDTRLEYDVNGEENLQARAVATVINEISELSPVSWLALEMASPSTVSAKLSAPHD